MHDDIYFVPLMDRALQQSDLSAALREAFSLIQRLGKEPRYRRGYGQFLKFMETVGAALRQGHAAAQRGASLALIIECDGRVLSVCCFDESSMAYEADEIGPGSYRVKTDTGLLLWEGNVTEDDVSWTRAFPEEPLPMAADTEKPLRELRRTIPLPEHGLVLCFHAGVESGSLEIKMGGAE